MSSCCDNDDPPLDVDRDCASQPPPTPPPEPCVRRVQICGVGYVRLVTLGNFGHKFHGLIRLVGDPPAVELQLDFGTAEGTLRIVGQSEVDLALVAEGEALLRLVNTVTIVKGVELQGMQQALLRLVADVQPAIKIIPDLGEGGKLRLVNEGEAEVKFVLELGDGIMRLVSEGEAIVQRLAEGEGFMRLVGEGQVVKSPFAIADNPVVRLINETTSPPVVKFIAEGIGIVRLIGDPPLLPPPDWEITGIGILRLVADPISIIPPPPPADGEGILRLVGDGELTDPSYEAEGEAFMRLVNDVSASVVIGACVAGDFLNPSSIRLEETQPCDGQTPRVLRTDSNVISVRLNTISSYSVGAGGVLSLVNTISINDAAFGAPIGAGVVDGWDAKSVQWDGGDHLFAMRRYDSPSFGYDAVLIEIGLGGLLIPRDRAAATFVSGEVKNMSVGSEVVHGNESLYYVARSGSSFPLLAANSMAGWDSYERVGNTLSLKSTVDHFPPPVAPNMIHGFRNVMSSNGRVIMTAHDDDNTFLAAGDRVVSINTFSNLITSQLIDPLSGQETSLDSHITDGSAGLIVHVRKNSLVSYRVLAFGQIVVVDTVAIAASTEVSGTPYFDNDGRVIYYGTATGGIGSVTYDIDGLFGAVKEFDIAPPIDDPIGGVIEFDNRLYFGEYCT